MFLRTANKEVNKLNHFPDCPWCFLLFFGTLAKNNQYCRNDYSILNICFNEWIGANQTKLMEIVEVNTAQLHKVFLKINVLVNHHDPNYIQPLDKDITLVFDPEKNLNFRFGTACRWVVKDDNGQWAGRIAAFTNSKYKTKGDDQPTGGIGFFDCINNQTIANLLFDTAKNWLQQHGMEAMDGPINFGERDAWWGLLVEGFSPPLYRLNYNQPYYQQLFESYGFQVFFNQICWERKVRDPLEQRFFDGHKKLAAREGFRAERVQKKNLAKYALDFATVYNKAWASHEGNKEMSPEGALKLFNQMKPVMDEDIAWMAYFKDEPVAVYLNLPDLNQIFRHFKGKFGLWEKLKFLWYNWRGKCNKMVGIIFGVVPRFQGMGLDYFLIVEAAKIVQHVKYEFSELQWQGDFHPKMMNISKHLGFTQNRRLITYRYLFDRNKPFVRHPLL